MGPHKESRPRYSKLTSDLKKSGSGKNFQMTERIKWVLTHFKFLNGHIMRRATVETAGFSLTAVSATSPNEPRGSATDAESTMEAATKFFLSDCLYTCTVARPGHGRHVPPDSGHAL